MTAYTIAALGIGGLAVFGVYSWFGGAVVRARRTGRRVDADKVLALASSLNQRQLWVALPFPKLTTDPKALPEEWSDRPRRWERVISKRDATLVLEGGERVDALGCEWYVYADTDGNALEFSVVGPGEVDQFDLPPGIDSESILPSDAKFGN